MHKLYANRSLLGNIALVVFLAFLVMLLSGGSGFAAPDPDKITPHVDFQNPVAVEDRDGNWILPGGTAKLKTTANLRQIKFTIQVLTSNFDALGFKLLDLQGSELTPEDTDISNLKREVYKQVYNTVYYIYQFIYTWRYKEQLEIAGSPNYEFLVTTNGTVLASVYLDLEAPPPEGGGGGYYPPPRPPRPAPVPAAGGFIESEAPGKATFTADAKLIEEILQTPGVHTVALILDRDQAGEEGIIQIGAEILQKIFNKGKKLLCEVAGISLLLGPGSFDLTPFVGEKATIRFRVAKSATATPTDPAYRLVSGIADVICRAASDGTDRGAVHFARPVELSFAYDRDRLGGAREEQVAIYRFDPAASRWEPVPGSRLNRAEGRVLCRRHVLSTYAAMAYQKTFADLVGHWAKADVEFLASRHIISGLTADQFAPERTITRAELAALLVRALGLEEGETAARFSDVPANAWYAGPVRTAAAAGLIKGYADNTFRPLATATRQEIAAVFARALEYEGKKLSVTSAEQQKLLNRFRDRAQIGAWAQAAVAGAVKEGILTGRQADIFAPRGLATRAEVAAMLKRVLNKLET